MKRLGFMTLLMTLAWFERDGGKCMPSQAIQKRQTIWRAQTQQLHGKVRARSMRAQGHWQRWKAARGATKTSFMKKCQSEA